MFDTGVKKNIIISARIILRGVSYQIDNLIKIFKLN